MDVFDYDTHKSAWSDVANAAERHYEPGKFTTFIAYEFTASTEGMGNLHRNVIFGSSKAPIRPYSRIDSLNPERIYGIQWTNGEKMALIQLRYLIIVMDQTEECLKFIKLMVCQWIHNI